MFRKDYKEKYLFADSVDFQINLLNFWILIKVILRGTAVSIKSENFKTDDMELMGTDAFTTYFVFRMTKKKKKKKKEKNSVKVFKSKQKQRQLLTEKSQHFHIHINRETQT